MSALSFEAVKVRITQNKQGVYLVLNIHPEDIPEELLRSWVGQRYYCALVGIQDDETPVPHKPITKKTQGRKYVDRAGIMAREKEFWKFAGVDSEEDASEFIRNFCNIHSRSELKRNEFAQILLEEINNKYNKWYEKQAKKGI
jgi:hypothetical protein|tara:strand:+ start:2719 stop:3147 length:429 start_codon:yes stop_codon:yes gene_type:complete